MEIFFSVTWSGRIVFKKVNRNIQKNSQFFKVRSWKCYMAIKENSPETFFTRIFFNIGISVHLYPKKTLKLFDKWKWLGDTLPVIYNARTFHVAERSRRITFAEPSPNRRLPLFTFLLNECKWRQTKVRRWKILELYEWLVLFVWHVQFRK